MTGGSCHSARGLLSSLSFQEQISCVLESGETQSGRPAGRGRHCLSRREVLAGGIGAGAVLAFPDVGSGVRSADQSGVSGRPAGRVCLCLRHAGSRRGPLAGPWPPRCRPAIRAGSARAGSARGGVCATACAVCAAGPGRHQARGRPGLVAGPGRHGPGYRGYGARRGEDNADPSRRLLGRRRQAGIGDCAGVPAGANVLVTPVFAPARRSFPWSWPITVPVSKQLVRKAHPHTGRPEPRLATTWRSHHALAYFDQRSGAMTGPFHLSDEPSLALSTAAASSSDLLLWTTREPQPDDPAEIRAQAPLSRLSVFPLGSGEGQVVGVGPGAVARRGTGRNASDR